MTAQYAVWREVNGHQSEYDPGPMEKKQAIKVATYQTSISIYRYFIKEIEEPAEWSRCLSCGHEWKNAGKTSDCCPLCGHTEWLKIDGPTPYPGETNPVETPKGKRAKAAKEGIESGDVVVIDMQSRPDPKDARSMGDPRFDEVWAHCRECKYQWQPSSQDEDCPSCGDKDWDVIDPPALTFTPLEAAHTAYAEAQGDKLVFRPGVSASRIGPVETRRAAHETAQVDPRSNRERVVALLKDAGIRGMTCDEIEIADGMQFTTAGAIIIDLRMEGWVVQGETEPTRPTRRGSNAVVWVHLDYQIPEAERNVEKMGKGKWKAACEQAYALMLADGWEDAQSVLAAAMGKNE